MSTDAHENSRPRPRRRLRPVLAALMIALAATALAACGSSGGSTSGSTSSTNSASTSKPAGPSASRFASLRACLQKEGINLPSRPSGSTGSTGSTGSGGGFPGARGGGFKLPAGVSQTKFQEALKKCGGGFLHRRNFNSATAKAALTKYSQCMRENGVDLPAPNTTGKGPVFNTSGLDRTSATFTAAEKKCAGDLPAFFGRGRPAAGGGPAAGAGAPPAGEGGTPPAEGGAPPSEGA
jgi:hypothetical protein